MRKEEDKLTTQSKRKVTMLEYCMTLLGKLSFDENLFRKEYRKALGYLKPVEREKLRNWVGENKHLN